METNSLIISHWNCNSIKSHKPEIYSLINKKHNFICLNETKLSNSDNISFENYEIIRKDRNRRGGGVAILARTDMKFEKIDTLDSFGLELLAIKVKLKNESFNLISLYIPPRKTHQDIFLDTVFFQELSKLQPFVMCGDLNSHSKNWNCTNVNSNGRTLEDLIISSNFSIINNKFPTHICPVNDSGSVIDLFIVSADLLSKLQRCYVKSSYSLSGHYPVVASFNMPTTKFSGRTILYKKVIDWDVYKNQFALEFKNHFHEDLTAIHEPDTLTTDYKLTTQIIEAATNAATTMTTRVLKCAINCARARDKDCQQSIRKSLISEYKSIR